MILVKNPTGCTQAIEYLSTIPGDFILVFCLNDRPADGKDVSWIWDANYELLSEQSPQIRKLIVSGDRAADMRIRLKYAGFPEEEIKIIQNPDSLVDFLFEESLPVYILPTYTAMLDLRSAVVRRCGGSEFWE